LNPVKRISIPVLLALGALSVGTAQADAGTVPSISRSSSAVSPATADTVWEYGGIFNSSRACANAGENAIDAGRADTYRCTELDPGDWELELGHNW
jgi:hypothetical protein